MNDDLRNALKELKEEIHTAAVSAVNKFTARTGTSPESIEIEMVDATLFNSPIRERGVGAVRVRMGVF